MKRTSQKVSEWTRLLLEFHNSTTRHNGTTRRGHKDMEIQLPLWTSLDSNQIKLWTGRWGLRQKGQTGNEGGVRETEWNKSGRPDLARSERGRDPANVPTEDKDRSSSETSSKEKTRSGQYRWMTCGHWSLVVRTRNLTRTVYYSRVTYVSHLMTSPPEKEVDDELDTTVTVIAVRK